MAQNRPRLRAEVAVEVPFHDVDVMEVVWHGHYLKYFELARAALLRQIDFDYPRMREAGYAWPVVDCRVKYVRSARYGDHLTVCAELKEYENRLVIDYEIRQVGTGLRLTKGQTIQVAVDMKNGELQFLSPPCLLSRLES